MALRGPDELAVSALRGGTDETMGPGQQQAELRPELAAHPDDAAAYEDWKGRQRRRKWLTEYGPTYDLSEDLRLRQFVRQRGGAWIQAAAVGVGLTGQPAESERVARLSAPRRLRRCERRSRLGLRRRRLGRHHQRR
jgi:hypothetical protein